MPLIPGTRLGVYDIASQLGEGGMGQVFRATDARLKRQVAIKVLPPSLAADADRLARFQREAEVLASLNHPNIAAIYGLEESGGVTALVMELVEGNDLSQRISLGAMPLDDALQIARQIAQALEAAHEQGIIHRDLKPANIKVRGDGTVKVLDFGLAKAIDPAAASSANVANSPTLTAHATAFGIILGTAAYMAPEQAKGKPVDKRADIWAFGVVLFEMLSGRAAFPGDTVTDIIAAVVTREPEWTLLPVTTPASIRRLLTRCLEKDPKRRLRDIGDARFEIEETIARGTSNPGAGETGPASAGRAGMAGSGLRGPAFRRLLAWTAMGVILGASLAAGLAWSGVWPRSRPLESRALNVSIVHTEGREVAAPAISPDGRRVAYRARRGDGMPLLWVRDLANGELRSLPGTEDGSLPFWSPDSRDLGFFAGSTLKRVSADGGPVRLVADNVGPWNGYGGAWGDGTIAFASQAGLFRVSANGGAVTSLTRLQSGDWLHCWPSFLPDGRRFLFTAKLWTRTAEASEQGIYLGSVDNPKIERLLPDLSNAVYASPGYLVFAREGTLAAVPFDLAAGRVTGPPIAIGSAVAIDAQFYFAAISASADGTLAVRPPPAVVFPDSNVFNAELRLVDRTGKGSRAASARLFSYFMALSPIDTHWLAASTLDPLAGTQDLSLIDLSKDRVEPVTTTRGFSSSPVWSADGKRFVFAYQLPGQIDDVYMKDLGTGTIQPVIQTQDKGEHPLAWSHDGRSLLVFTYDTEKGTLSSWSFASRTLTPFIGPGAVESAAFSPLDDYVAFASRESGRSEVYVTTFPDHRQTWPLTTDGGQVLSWSADGREILVATLSGHIVGYPVSTKGGFSFGQPTTLLRDVGAAAVYSSATRDHSHVLIRVSPDAAKDKGEIRLLFDWQAALR